VKSGERLDLHQLYLIGEIRKKFKDPTRGS
jgi:hypothetical protein